MIVLDTNVLSELMKAAPSRRVISWVAARPVRSLYVTSITQAEILHGVMLLPARRKSMESVVAAIFEEEFAGRVLAFGSDAAAAYASIAAHRRRTGRPIALFDAQIAAITLANGASIATRNVADFADCGMEVINPWTDG